MHGMALALCDRQARPQEGLRHHPFGPTVHNFVLEDSSKPLAALSASDYRLLGPRGYLRLRA
eukprot:3906355-Amphidinium_carterae.1